VGRGAIVHGRAFFQSVTEGADDEEAERTLPTGMLPATRRDLLDVEDVFSAGCIGSDANPGDVRILADFLRRRQTICSILTSTATRQEKVQS